MIASSATGSLGGVSAASDARRGVVVVGEAGDSEEQTVKAARQDGALARRISLGGRGPRGDIGHNAARVAGGEASAVVIDSAELVGSTGASSFDLDPRNRTSCASNRLVSFTTPARGGRGGIGGGGGDVSGVGESANERTEVAGSRELDDSWPQDNRLAASR